MVGGSRVMRSQAPACRLSKKSVCGVYLLILHQAKEAIWPNLRSMEKEVMFVTEGGMIG